MAEWYKDWFSTEEYLNIYRHRDNKDANDLFQLILQNIHNEKDRSVLDVCCGAGRHSLLFAKNGFKVTGFDLSKFLLKIAKENSCYEKLNINLFCADQRKFSLNKKYQLILNLFTSFGYFETDEENFLLFKNVFEHLDEKGIFVFDYFNSVYLKDNLIEESVSENSGDKMIQKRSIKNSRVEKDIVIQNGGTEKIFHESVKLYTVDEILDKLRSCNFKIRNIYGSYSGENFDRQSSSRLIIFAEK